VTPVPVEEWYFDPLPNSQVEGCLLYELTREACLQCETIHPYLRRISILKDAGDDSAKLMIQRGVRTAHFHLASMVDHLPKTSFQNLEYQTRKQFCENLPKVEREDIFPLDDKHAFQHIETRNRDRSEKDYAFACFEIYWGKKNEELCQQFLQWLKDHRPSDQPGRDLSPKLKIERGVLKALGAYRLLKVMDTVAASDYAKFVIKKSFYSAKAESIFPSWSRAKAKAEKAIREHILTFPKSE
jgi:hypothetical protein